MTILTALDMSVAYDTLVHATLLHRLQHTLLSSGFVHISYLFDCSSFLEIYLEGILQGSVLDSLNFFSFFFSQIANYMLCTCVEDQNEPQAFLNYFMKIEVKQFSSASGFIYETLL